MKNTRKRKKAKDALKDIASNMLAWLGALGIVFGLVLVGWFLIWAISSLSNQNKAEEPVVLEYEKSVEQKRYEQECTDVNVAWQEEPDTSFKIKKDLIVTYCGCMGDSLFPNGSEKAIFPEDNMALDKTCRIRTFSEEYGTVWSEHGYADSSDYGKLSTDFGDKKFILDSILEYNRSAIASFWYEYGYNISIDDSCVSNNIYDDENPTYYYETAFMNGKVVSAIRACSNDPRIEEFLDF